MGTWYHETVFYHIYPLGLCGAPKTNTESQVVNRLEILDKWIPHIKNIGCDGIYIGPLFESVGHGYETTDYKKVDRRLGTNDDFKRFVELCHGRGIKVIVDGVFNHTGREFFAFQDLHNNRERSPYIDWYCNVNFQGNNEFNDGFSYESWRGYNILVKLNQRNSQVKEYLFDVIRFWVEEFDIDGIRLDAADVLDFDFMAQMRLVANEVKENFWLMGEVIHGDYNRWANEKMLHSVTNYELHKGLYSGHNDHNYFEIAHTVKRIENLCGDTRLYTFVDNHDVNRIVNKLNEPEHLFPVYVLLYTLPGIPSLYYGSEFSIDGIKENGSDDGIRPYIPLEDYCVISGEGKDAAVESYVEGRHSRLLEWILKLGQMRKDYNVLSYGRYQEILLTNRQYVFARVGDQGAVVVAVNNDEKETLVNISLPMGGANVMDLFSQKDIPVEKGGISITVEGNSGRIFYVS